MAYNGAVMARSTHEEEERGIWSIVWAGSALLLLAFSFYLAAALPEDITAVAFFPALFSLGLNVVASVLGFLGGRSLYARIGLIMVLLMLLLMAAPIVTMLVTALVVLRP